MRKILIGEEKTKRTDYFRKAAEQLHTEVEFCDISTLPLLCERFTQEKEEAFVKLDPVSYQSGELERMNELVADYCDKIVRLEKGCPWLHFLNSPREIVSALNKLECKEQLLKHGVPVTQMISSNLHTTEELKGLMEQNHLEKVFVKPIFGSGAAGVLAYQFHPKKNQEILYTSCALWKGNLVNTKTLYRLDDANTIRSIMDKVFLLGTVVERWYPKAIHNGQKYDLRVLYQFGKIDFIVARQSKGPITNLHLNNLALSVSELNLTEQTMQEIAAVCAKVMEAYAGLAYAGIDILLENHTHMPYVIEVNGQGDLLYQDIYNKNLIYKNQILYWNA